jgi:hypothetical protein
VCAGCRSKVASQTTPEGIASSPCQIGAKRKVAWSNFWNPTTGFVPSTEIIPRQHAGSAPKVAGETKAHFLSLPRSQMSKATPEGVRYPPLGVISIRVRVVGMSDASA